MSHVAHITGDVAGRGLQIAGLLVGAARGHAARRDLRRLDDLSAAEALADEVHRLRRLVAHAQAEAARARRDSVALGLELAAANQRADRAESALARFAGVVRQRLARA
ncbi:hypothetical protein G3T14_10720 [Methylobacterium sp. BTF04]|uniref:hypothetical protein n=1 Tax=Methylobacterium sp. BTF04 TaxID=2708300 RepID=UPI0013D02264|nr:hypothetical protein [Methylobacterium sp. BTF04]NEU12610.1 hypothetical protein [Methylobacterium sp. BTF04]